VAEHVDVGRAGKIKCCETGVTRAPLRRPDVDPVDPVANEQAPDNMGGLVDQRRLAVGHRVASRWSHSSRALHGILIAQLRGLPNFTGRNDPSAMRGRIRGSEQ
jgi:hypothetical protein